MERDDGKNGTERSPLREKTIVFSFSLSLSLWTKIVNLALAHDLWRDLCGIFPEKSERMYSPLLVSRSEKYYIFQKVKNYFGRSVSLEEERWREFSERVLQEGVKGRGEKRRGEGVGIRKWWKGSMVERVARHLAISKQRNRKFSQTRYACSFYDGPLTRKPGRGTG